jgi:hypothetical protein
MKAHQLAVNFKVPETKDWVHVHVFKRNEPEALTPARLPVEHDR